jgi:ribose transport system substrate-binding protein
MQRRKRTARFGAAAGALAAVIAISACGSSGGGAGSSGSTASSGASGSGGKSKTYSINVGTSTPIKVSGTPKIAFFISGTTDAYGVAYMKAMKADVAKIPGASLTIFDGNFNATTQLNQIQDAESTNKYNAYIINPNDGPQLCSLGTKAAAAKNIPVVVVQSALCNNGSAANWTGQYSAGTLEYVGIYTTDLEEEFLAAIAKENPGPQRVVLLTGPTLWPTTPDIETAFKWIQKRDPGFKLIAQAPTDFSVAEGQQKLLPILQANKNATIVFSVYSDIAEGAATAIKEAGLSGKIKSYDIGVSTWDGQALKDGQLNASLSTGYPVNDAAHVIDAFKDAFSGKQPPKVVPNDGAPLKKSQILAGGKTKPIIITKANISTFTPQYGG